MKTMREIYKETGRASKNFKKFYNIYQDRYMIESPDEALKPEIELAMMVDAGLCTILEMIVALTNEDDEPDPLKTSATLIDFKRELRIQNKTIQEQDIEIAAQKVEIETLRSIFATISISPETNQSNTFIEKSIIVGEKPITVGEKPIMVDINGSLIEGECNRTKNLKYLEDKLSNIVNIRTIITNDGSEIANITKKKLDINIERLRAEIKEARSNRRYSR